MRSVPREILCGLIAEHGSGLCKDVRRCDALLRDLCGEDRREVNVLIAATRARVGIQLLAALSTTPPAALVARQTRRLCDDFAMEEQAARWAVETWAIALGLIKSAEGSHESIVAPRPVSKPIVVRSDDSQSQAESNPIDGAALVWIPSGEFLMGDDDQKDNPRRRVMLDGFWIYRTPVTVKQYIQFCTVSGRKPPEPPTWGWRNDHPVVNVSWDDAAAYARWAGGRLPTEAQWEKAARGTDGRLYPWGNTWDGSRCTHSVGAARASTSVCGALVAGGSPYGVLEMAGNVWQWCADWYEESFPRTGNSRNPEGPLAGERRVLRGGSWNDTMPFIFRSAMRFRYNPHGSFISFGFRCAAPPS